MSAVHGVVTGLVLMGGVAWAGAANAQEEEQPAPPLRPPKQALELRFGAGYAQGFGNLAPNKTIVSAAGAGAGLGIDVDYRATPYLSAGLETQFQEFTAENSSAARTLAANIGATYHIKPYEDSEPWVRIGTGYRFFWNVHPVGSNGTTDMYHGFDIVTAKVGYDFRVDEDVAFAPVVGADLQTFVWRDGQFMTNTQIGTFIYAGLQGRFDVAGKHAPTPTGPTGVARSAL